MYCSYIGNFVHCTAAIHRVAVNSSPSGGAENAGVENAGVEKLGAMTDGEPSV